MAFLVPLSFMLALVVETVLHEFAHALVAVLVGLRLRRVVIGRGAVVWRKQVGEWALELRSLPQSGSVHVIPSVRRRSVAMFAFIAAGPLSTFVLLTGVIQIGQQVTNAALGNALILPAMFALLLSLLFNLWPRLVKNEDTRLATDGLAMLQILRGNSTDRYRQGFETFLARYLQTGERLPALSANSDAVAWWLLGPLLPPGKSFAEIRASSENVLSRDLAQCERVAILDMLVSWGLAEGDPSLAANLDRWSSEAYSLAPAIATIVASRGSALIDIGRVTDGLSMLRHAEDGEVLNDCLVHAFRALGHFKLGQNAQAAVEFSRSRVLYPPEAAPNQLVDRTIGRIARTIGIEFRAKPAQPIYTSQDAKLDIEEPFS